MENLCKGAILGFAMGLVVGGIVVAKNKKLATKIKDGTKIAETKIEEAKDMLKEKMESGEFNFEQGSIQNEQLDKNSKK
mgnify:CR=1 FL=1